MGKTLGIIGGMGPLATNNLFNKIVTLTEAVCDQEHLNILIHNNPLIPDRTEYILNSGESPLEYLIETAKGLEASGADYLIMPCNTAHYFYNEIIKHINIPFLNMIAETAKYTEERYNIRRVGLLATEGTIKAKIYEDEFNPLSIEVVVPSEERQKSVSKLIYDIKGGKLDIDVDDFREVIKELKEKGVQTFILGCTELSTAYAIHRFKGNFIDPLELISVRAIEYSDKKIKQENLITINKGKY